MNHRITRLSSDFFNKDKEEDWQSSDHCNCIICNLKFSFINEIEQVCDFCWYDFYASQTERQKLNCLDSFRDRSVRIWYTNLGANKTTLSTLSPLTIMYILHDCFRSNDHLSMENTLKIASNLFPESVSWLGRLLKGNLPILALTESDRIYKFSAGINRTPIWYKVETRSTDKNEDRSLWKWTPNHPYQWIACPQLEVPFEPWIGEVPREENVFIILFLHTFGPYPPYSDPQSTQNFLINEQMFNKISQNLPKSLSATTEEKYSKD